MTYEREMTAPMTAVGAVVGQSTMFTPTIIPESEGYFNPSDEEIFLAQQEYEQEMQAMAQAERKSAPTSCRRYQCLSRTKWCIRANHL